MPDITMCKGCGCNLKNTCYRHIAEPSEFRQSWFVNTPNEGIECSEYWETEIEIQE